MSTTVRHIILGAIGTLLVLIVIGLLIVLTGGYNIAATERHNPVIGWALTTTMRNHVQGAADDLTAPEITPAMISAGAGEYKSMCEHCHGGVGTSRAGWAKTMRPIPPALAHAAQRWSVEEVRWIVQHGVKMSGMPAFGPTHDETTVWNIAAFVKAMPDMTDNEYARYSAGTQSSSHAHARGTNAHGD